MKVRLLAPPDKYEQDDPGSATERNELMTRSTSSRLWAEAVWELSGLSFVHTIELREFGDTRVIKVTRERQGGMGYRRFFLGR